MTGTLKPQVYGCLFKTRQHFNGIEETFAFFFFFFQDLGLFEGKQNIVTDFDFSI